MSALRIPRVLDEKSFQVLSNAWDAAADASIYFDDQLELRERDALIRFLLDHLPNDFAFSLLSTLAEGDDVGNDLLKEIFERGDVSCKVSVCLRDGLSAEIELRCETSSIAEVREHFLSKRSNGEVRGK